MLMEVPLEVGVKSVVGITVEALIYMALFAFDHLYSYGVVLS